MRRRLPYPDNLTYYLYKDDPEYVRSSVSVTFNTRPVVEAVAAMTEENEKVFVNLYFEEGKALKTVASEMYISIHEAKSLRETTCIHLRKWLRQRNRDLDVLLVSLAQYSLLKGSYVYALQQAGFNLNVSSEKKKKTLFGEGETLENDQEGKN